MELGTEIWPRLNMSSSQYQVLCLSKFDNVILCSCNQNVKTFLSSRIPFVSRLSIILEFVRLSQFLELPWRQKASNILLCSIQDILADYLCSNIISYKLLSAVICLRNCQLNIVIVTLAVRCFLLFQLNDQPGPLLLDVKKV